MIEWNSFHYVKILPFSRYLLRCSISSTNLSIRFSFLGRGGEGITFGVIFGREKTKGRKRSLKRGGKHSVQVSAIVVSHRGGGRGAKGMGAKRGRVLISCG